MGILKIENDGYTLEYARGDSKQTRLTMRTGGQPIDITGYSFLLTVNSDLDPVDTSSQLFSLPGTVENGPGGVVSFAPTETDTDLSPNTYFYDVQMTDTGGRVSTLYKAKFSIVQDITKS